MKPKTYLFSSKGSNSARPQEWDNNRMQDPQEVIGPLPSSSQKLGFFSSFRFSLLSGLLNGPFFPNRLTGRLSNFSCGVHFFSKSLLSQTLAPDSARESPHVPANLLSFSDVDIRK